MSKYTYTTHNFCFPQLFSLSICTLIRFLTDYFFFSADTDYLGCVTMCFARISSELCQFDFFERDIRCTLTILKRTHKWAKRVMKTRITWRDLFKLDYYELGSKLYSLEASSFLHHNNITAIIVLQAKRKNLVRFTPIYDAQGCTCGWWPLCRISHQTLTH